MQLEDALKGVKQERRKSAENSSISDVGLPSVDRLTRQAEQRSQAPYPDIHMLPKLLRDR